MVAMSEKDELKKAIDLSLQGKRKEAAAILVALESKIKEPNMRLRLIDASLAILNPVKDNPKLIDLAEEAIKITASGDATGYQAYFMARKADLLRFQIGLRQHRMASLTLTPSWIAFAIETDKKEYDVLKSETEKMETESESLMEQALLLADKSGDKKTKGHILLQEGQILSSKYLQSKTECLRNTLYGKLWVKFQFGRYPFFENLFGLRNKNIRKLSGYVKSFRESFLEAGRLFEEIADPSSSNAYFNLANDLKTAYRFREANKWLKKARVLALKYNDLVMVTKIDEMEKIVAAKNKDVPDYINGEERENGSM